MTVYCHGNIESWHFASVTIHYHENREQLLSYHRDDMEPCQVIAIHTNNNNDNNNTISICAAQNFLCQDHPKGTHIHKDSNTGPRKHKYTKHNLQLCDNAGYWHFVIVTIRNREKSLSWQCSALTLYHYGNTESGHFWTVAIHCHVNINTEPWQLLPWQYKTVTIHCHENTELCDNYCHDNTRQFIAITIQKWDNSHNDSSEPGQHKAVTI